MREGGGKWVSILVLMESTFRRQKNHQFRCRKNLVSILVLMESTFRRCTRANFLHSHKSFNPCFNGINIQTSHRDQSCFCQFDVSILVLMESTFRPLRFCLFPSAQQGFNPCFNGINIQTLFLSPCPQR